MRLNVEIDGLSKLTSQLADLVGDADAVVTETITRVVMDTRANAIQGIQRGPATGRVRADGSRASAPGEFPMSDTGRLANSMEFNLPTAGRLTGEVGTNVIYGRHLEFGTSRMGARPWLLPSFKMATADVEKRLKKAIEART